jgi:hypothetical protein
MVNTTYPVTYSVDYPDRQLDRLTSFFRPFVAIPILIVLGAVSAATYQTSNHGNTITIIAGAGGFLFLGPLLMILFRQKYPRWWFDWNVELLRFVNRVIAYLLLMDDHYPSTDEVQSVHLDLPYPNVQQDLNRGLPLIKWFLAIPHYFVLFFLGLATFFVAIIVWFAILFTGRYPRSLFTFIEGVIRWNNRVIGYALILTTDQYPPFRLSA